MFGVRRTQPYLKGLALGERNLISSNVGFPLLPKGVKFFIVHVLLLVAGVAIKLDPPLITAQFGGISEFGV